MAGRKSTATMELAIGATIIAGVILLIVMLMAWGSSTSFLGQHYRVVVNMANVGGLKEGAPVKLGGFQIGRVASIRIRSGGTDMEIVLDIDEERLLPRDSTAKISTAGLVGDAFMEIIPGTSSETVTRASTVAEADRLDSSPLPDLSELFTRVNQLGDQFTILTANLNDIVGDDQFRRNVKSLMQNMDAVSYQANLILQRGPTVMDNIELASQNVTTLTTAALEKFDEISEELTTIVNKVSDITVVVEKVADRSLDLADKAVDTIDNLDGGITEAREALKNTIGDPDFAANLNDSLANIKTITEGLAERRPDIDTLLVNLSLLSEDFKTSSVRIREITENIEPKLVGTTITTLNSAILSLTEVVNRIKAEPVLALSVNKAADRIVKMKFDEMQKSGHFRTADEVLREVNRWIRQEMNSSFFHDPKYAPDRRPYVLEP